MVYKRVASSVRRFFIGSMTLSLLTGCAPEAADALTPTIDTSGSSSISNAGRDNTANAGPGAATSNPGSATGNDSSNNTPPNLQPFIDAAKRQLNDRSLELGSSLNGSGGDALTSLVKLNLCGFGSARIVETQIFSGSTPTDSFGFDSETISDGVWDVVVIANQLVLEIREGFALSNERGEIIRQFSLQVAQDGGLAGIDGRSFDVTDFTAQCAQAEANQRPAAEAFAALSNQRVLLSAGTQSAELLLCESGLYSMKILDAGQLALLEGGAWSISHTPEAGTELVLQSDPRFDQSGQSTKSTFAVTRNAGGQIVIGNAQTRLEPIASNCEAAVQQELQ